jgi:hypothetical protein
MQPKLRTIKVAAISRANKLARMAWDMMAKATRSVRHPRKSRAEGGSHKEPLRSRDSLLRRGAYFR